MCKLDQIKALETGKGIQYLLDSAYKIFGNPIVMFDTHYALIAYTDVVTDDPLWNKLVSTGTFSIEEQEFFSSERFTEDVANADKLVVMKSNKLKYDRILGNIFNRESVKVANIVIVECKAPFGADIQVAFEAFADKVTNEIQDDDNFTEYGKAYHNDLIKKLLDHQINDPMIYTAHVQILYDGFEDYLYLAAVGLLQSDTSHDKLVFFKGLLENRYPSFKFAIYSDYIVMIMSSKYNNLSTEWFLGDQENPFVKNSLFVGISSSFENLYELRKYYNEAVTALRNGIVNSNEIANSNRQRIFFYDNN